MPCQQQLVCHSSSAWDAITNYSKLFTSGVRIIGHTSIRTTYAYCVWEGGYDMSGFYSHLMHAHGSWLALRQRKKRKEVQFVQSFRFYILQMYDSCHICFWPIFFASFPISASQLTASPLRRRNAISVGCVLTVNTLTCVLTHWNRCLNLCSWIEWRAHLCFTPIDSSFYFQKVYHWEGQAGKLLPDDMEGWHSERNCTCVRKKRIACWRAKTWVPSQMHSLPSTKSHSHSLFPKK